MADLMRRSPRRQRPASGCRLWNVEDHPEFPPRTQLPVQRCEDHSGVPIVRGAPCEGLAGSFSKVHGEVTGALLGRQERIKGGLFVRGEIGGGRHACSVPSLTRTEDATPRPNRTDMMKRTPAPYRGEYDDRTIGLRLRRVRNHRGMSLQAVADLAGTSDSTLSRIETGQTALDSHKLLFALADTLRIAPSDLLALPIPAPGNGNTDASIQAVRHALMAVTADHLGGEVQTVEQLHSRYQNILDKNRQEHGDFKECGTLIPSLITDLHTALAQRRELGELLPLASLFHSGPVGNFLANAGASIDLRWQNVMFARTLTENLEDPILLDYVSANQATKVMVDSGAFDLASDELDSTSVSTATDEGRQVNGVIALHRSLVAAAEGRPAESAAALDHAAELAATMEAPFTGRLGQDLGFCLFSVGLWRMFTVLESDDADEAIRVAEGLNPEEHPFAVFRASYWTIYGRALTRVRRRDDAARALLSAEKLHPVRVLRNPFARETLVELLAHAKDDALGREVRGMAYRARLPLLG